MGAAHHVRKLGATGRRTPLTKDSRFKLNPFSNSRDDLWAIIPVIIWDPVLPAFWTQAWGHTGVLIYNTLRAHRGVSPNRPRKQAAPISSLFGDLTSGQTYFSLHAPYFGTRVVLTTGCALQLQRVGPHYQEGNIFAAQKGGTGPNMKFRTIKRDPHPRPYISWGGALPTLHHRVQKSFSTIWRRPQKPDARLGSSPRERFKHPPSGARLP